MRLTPLTLKTHEVKTSAWGVPGKGLPFPARQPKPEDIEAFGSLDLGRLRPLREKRGVGTGPEGILTTLFRTPLIPLTILPGSR